MSHAARNIAVLLTVALCFSLAAGSVVIHRQVTMEGGNLCERTTDNPNGFCYGPEPVGGWPFAFLYDDQATSVIGQLGPEDDFRPGWFLADMATFGTLATLVAVAVHLLRRRRPAGSPI
jgi:hypothetical protein